VGNYALFGGGTGPSSTVDAYNTSLTRTTPTALSVARDDIATTTVGNYALFGGGGGPSNIVDAYDTSLVRTMTALSVARDRLAATTVGDYALFGGGGGPSSASTSAVDAYKSYPDTYPLWITPGSKYNFGAGEQVATSSVVIVTNPVTGYIKYKKGVVS
jgi:hypothetical protein